MTTPSWYLVRYMPDLHRREPRNVGVVLRAGENNWLTKFLGERDDGTINGQLLRRDINVEVYKTWVAYFQRKASDETWADVERMQLSRVRNFYAEPGGEYLGRVTSWQSLLEDLFADLVEEPGLPAVPTVKRERIDSRVERILQHAGIKPEKNVQVSAKFGNEIDLVPFKYSYQNGQMHLMDILSARRNIQQATSDARELRARVQGVIDAGHTSSFVAFYDHELFPEDELYHVLRPIRGISRTVDVGLESSAAKTVKRIMAHSE